MNQQIHKGKNSDSADIIVIGVGSMGSAACYYLARRGYKVLGLEQFDITHEFGSHAGQSRIIRKAYFEHPDYVPLLNRAYENWKNLEEEAGEQVYFQTGLLYAGNPDHEIMRGVRLSASLYNIELKQVKTADSGKWFEEFNLPDHFEILFEPEAGFVRPEKAITLYTELARKQGAIIHIHEKVLNWKTEGKSVIVSTDKNVYHSKKLVITSGAWAGKMIPGFADKIKSTRQFVAWIKPKADKKILLNHFPCWMIADDQKPGCYYGFPMLPTEKFGLPEGLKLARHFPSAVTDPDKVNRETTEEDKNDLMYCLDKYLPGTFESFFSSKICLYGNSPDGHFIIDNLPGYKDNVCIACGFSGHGFKFASAVGEILADLATEGKTNFPIEFLNAKRFS